MRPCIVIWKANIGFGNCFAFVVLLMVLLSCKDYVQFFSKQDETSGRRVTVGKYGVLNLTGQVDLLDLPVKLILMVPIKLIFIYDILYLCGCHTHQ